ncbi:MAG: CvpA family protein [Clostridia bacterium]|nr:CvpA family protein [Clostridia bacterium]
MKNNSQFSPVRIIVNLLITLAAAGIYFYVELPTLNFRSMELWIFIVLALALFSFLTLITAGIGITRSSSPSEVFKGLWRVCKIPVILIAAIVVFCLVGNLCSAVIFNSKAYSNLIEVEESDFTADINEISYEQIPQLDKDSASVLANRKLGELRDLVSQFEVEAESAQINYNDRPVRVTYLNYGDFFKWIKNTKNGIPAYLITDMVTQEVTVVRTESGIKYSPSEYFNRNISRHLRFNYPTLMFEDINFEIDEDGTPYFVASVMTKRIGIFGGRDIVGAVLCNAITGESVYYDAADIPTWVDRIFTADLLIEQYDYRGMYQNGFWNSIFGQTGCTVTTEGYNYIAQDDDVWMYTGITSVGGDQSNIGFILVNQRTKTARFYSIAGAEEFSAMDSAEGVVQQYGYVAAFPLLLNIKGQPTYFLPLKDASSLVKMYAMVNVQQYQIVAYGTSLAECEENYDVLLMKNGLIENEPDIPDTPEEDKYETELTGVITEIRQAVIDGTTVYYVAIDTLPEKYLRLSAADNENAAILNVGDTITVSADTEDTEAAILSSILK